MVCVTSRRVVILLQHIISVFAFVLFVLHNRSKSNVLKVKSHNDEEKCIAEDEGKAMGGSVSECGSSCEFRKELRGSDSRVVFK